MSSTQFLSFLRLRDLLHPVVAGLISVIVNYGGTFILVFQAAKVAGLSPCLLYTSPSPRDATLSRMPSSA